VNPAVRTSIKLYPDWNDSGLHLIRADLLEAVCKLLPMMIY